MKKILVILLGFFLIGLVSAVSASTNLLLSNSTWEVTASYSASISYATFYGSSDLTHDGDLNTKMYVKGWNCNPYNHYYEYTFPNSVQIGKIAVNHGGYLLVLNDPSDGSQNVAIKVRSDGTWIDISSYCSESSNSIVVHNFLATEECIGNWNNVDKIIVTLLTDPVNLGAGCISHESHLFEVQAFAPLCVPSCAGKECGDDGCGGICGDCNVLYPGQESFCQSGFCKLIFPPLCNVNNFSRLYRTWDEGYRHFYTANKEENAMKIKENWIYEGIEGYIFNLSVEGTIPLYRLQNKTSGWYILTNSSTEKESLLASDNLVDEGIVGYVYSSSGADRVPLHRYKYVESGVIKDYAYTTSEKEKKKIDDTESWPWINYQYQGIVGYLKNFSINDSTQLIMGLNKFKDSNGSLWNSSKEFVMTVPATCLGSSSCGGLTKTQCEVLAPDCGWISSYDIYNYPGAYPIYYDEIFGEVYTGANPHSCTGNNKILGLLNKKNSLAEIPSLDNYNYDVCYGNLICEADTSTGNNCNDIDKRIVVRLNTSTNSLVSDACNSDYPIKICCKPTPTTSLSEAYWANMKNTQITSANLNDLVKLYVAGSGISGEINYTIWKDVAWWFDKKVAQSSSYGYMTWRAGKKSDGSLENGTYYFKAKLEEGSEVQSGTLSVSSTIHNTPPTARILSPIDRQIYFVDEDINFSAEISDPDDGFRYVWNLGDGRIKQGNSTNWDNYQFITNYTTGGQKDIILNVTDDRGKYARTKVSILVVDSDVDAGYTLAYIDNPKWGEKVQGFKVFVNASSSYVVNYTNSGNIKCVNGFCVQKTEGFHPNPTKGQLNVEYAPLTINDAVYNEMNFTWRFYEDARGIGEYKENSGKGKGNAIFYYNGFLTTGQHLIELMVSLNPTSSTTSLMDVYYTSQCYYPQGLWFDSDGIFYDTSTFSGRGFCQYDNCCKENYECVYMTKGDASSTQCVPKDEVIGCSYYTNPINCTNDFEKRAEKDCKRDILKVNETCEIETGRSHYVKDVGCECVWVTDSCYNKAKYIPLIYEKEIIDDADIFYCLDKKVYEEKCSKDGWRSFSVNRIIEWSLGVSSEVKNACKDSCGEGDKGKVRCGTALLKLYFFSLIGAIAVVLILGIVYYLSYSKKKTRKTKTKGRTKFKKK